MQRFVKQRAFNDDYREQLADERTETERKFILEVLARKEAESRRPDSARMDGR